MSDTPNPVPAPIPTATVVTPGWRTSEFWLKVAAFALTALFASGVIPTSGPIAQVAAIAATMLGALGYTVARSFVKAAGAGVLAIALLAGGTQTACGGSQASRSATISSVDSGVRSMVAALRTYEHVHAESAIANAQTLDDGKAALSALRARTAPAWRALDLAFAALDSASTVNDDPSVRGAQKALNDAIAAVEALTGGTP